MPKPYKKRLANTTQMNNLLIKLYRRYQKISSIQRVLRNSHGLDVSYDQVDYRLKKINPALKEKFNYFHRFKRKKWTIVLTPAGRTFFNLIGFCNDSSKQCMVSLYDCMKCFENSGSMMLAMIKACMWKNLDNLSIPVNQKEEKFKEIFFLPPKARIVK